MTLPDSIRTRMPSIDLTIPPLLLARVDEVIE
jgi:hypothetical protein